MLAFLGHWGYFKPVQNFFSYLREPHCESWVPQIVSPNCTSIYPLASSNEKCMHSFFVWKSHWIRKHLKSDKTIPNRPAIARYEIFLTQKLCVRSFCNHKIGIIDMHFKNNKFYLKSRSDKPRSTIWNIGSWIPKLDFYSVLP